MVKQTHKQLKADLMKNLLISQDAIYLNAELVKQIYYLD